MYKFTITAGVSSSFGSVEPITPPPTPVVDGVYIEEMEMDGVVCIERGVGLSDQSKEIYLNTMNFYVFGFNSICFSISVDIRPPKVVGVIKELACIHRYIPCCQVLSNPVPQFLGIEQIYIICE